MATRSRLALFDRGPIAVVKEQGEARTRLALFFARLRGLLKLPSLKWGRSHA